jgi:transglutaminase-like putative cysteine protease
LVHGYYYNYESKQLEHHSWADAWLFETGWQSFDIANNALSNGIHIRLATGLDYHDACPIISMLSNEQMSVDFKVQTMNQQQ